MTGDLTLGIVLKADGSGLVGEVRLSSKELDALGKAGKRAGDGARQGGQSFARFQAQMRRGREASRRMRGELGSLRRNFINLRNTVAAGILIAGVREAAKTELAYQSVNRALISVTGSSEAARREMAFVERTAERLGLRLIASAQGYTKLTAAAKDTALEGQAVRNIYLAISEAGVALGLSNDELTGTYRALEQMISKGNVQAEELRGQLGERLPGAFQLAAAAMGVTTQELNKMLDNGEVLATDLLPRLADTLHKKFGKAAVDASREARAELNRFNNAFDDPERDIATSGVLDSLVEGANALRDAFRDPAFRDGVREITRGIVNMLRFAVEHHKELTVLATTIVGLRLGAVAGGKAGAGVGAAGGALLGLGVVADGAGRPEANARIPGVQRDDYRSVPGLRVDIRPKLSAAQDRKGELERLLAARRESESRFENLSLLQDAEKTTRKKGLGVLTSEGQEYESVVRDILRLEAAIKKAGEANARHVDTVKDIQAEYLKLKSPYDQAIAAANKWRDEALAGLDSTKAGYDDFASQVEEIYADQLVAAQEEHLRSSKEWSDGAIRAFKDYADAAGDMASNVEGAITGLVGSMEDDFVRAELTLGSFADAFEAEMRRILFRSTVGQASGVIEDLLKSVFNLPGSGGGSGGSSNPTAVQIAHSGAIAGGAGPRRMVDASIFANAPRFHEGTVLPGEQAAILKDGEGVFTPEQMAALGPGGDPVRIEIIDQRGANAPPPQVSQSRGANGERIFKVMFAAEAEDYFNSGRGDTVMSQNYGAQRQGRR